MTTGQSEMLVATREPVVIGRSLADEPANDDEKNEEAARTTRSRKKVTFDLDLQVRTIPNRIPVYERRPAYYNNSGHLVRANGQQSYALVPKPLDLRSRDRYLIGAANLSAKRIIDLFSGPGSHPNYPAPPRGHTRLGHPPWRRQTSGYGSVTTSPARHPAYAYDGTKSAKMSRAAANLKQITAALGEHFDSSVYQEWDSATPSGDKRGTSPAGRVPQRGKESPDLTGGSTTCNTISLAPSRGFPPAKQRPHLPFRHQLSPQSISPTDSNQDSSGQDAARGSSAERTRSLSLPAGVTALTTTRKPSEPSPMSSTQLIISKAPSSQRPDARRRSDGGVYPGQERFRRVPSARDRSERTSSRCSSIDTYVISEPFDPDANTPKRSPPGAPSRIGSAHRPTPPAQGKNRSVVAAWEGAELSVTEPALSANALRTSKPAHGNYSLGGMGQGNFQVTTKLVNNCR